MTDFAYDGPIFLVPLSPSYPSSPVQTTLNQTFCKMILDSQVVKRTIEPDQRVLTNSLNPTQGLSQYLETGCPNRGFLDFCVSKMWYKVHTTNKINPIYLQILLFRPVAALCVL